MRKNGLMVTVICVLLGVGLVFSGCVTTEQFNALEAKVDRALSQSEELTPDPAGGTGSRDPLREIGRLLYCSAAAFACCSACSMNMLSG